MIFETLLVIAAAFPSVTLAQNFTATKTYTETLGNYTFIKAGPTTLKPKIEYDDGFGHVALDLLKTSLGPDGLIQTLQPAIKEADAFWHNIVNSTNGSWVPVDAQVQVFIPDLTAVRFGLWTQSDLADKANMDANAEHYVKRTTKTATGLTSEIVEGWGGVTTHFTIPDYSTPNRTKYPFLRAQPQYPLALQAAGSKVLMDGTVFGVLHIAVRDILGANYGQPINGIEVMSTVWYPNSVQEDHVEVEREHMTVEIENLTTQAKKDLDSGAFKPGV